MPKQVWTGNSLQIQWDMNDPNDQHEKKIHDAKGQSIGGMNPAQLVDLLTALNAKYGLGLNL